MICYGRVSPSGSSPEVLTLPPFIDEHGNSYTGFFIWDSEDEIHYLGEHKLVARYETNQLFIVKPMEDDTISGFLAEISKIKKEN